MQNILCKGPRLVFNKILITGLVLIAFASTVTCSAQSGVPARTLLALSKADHTLAIVDPATLKVIARVPVGPDPHEVIASSDGKTAYVSNMGNGNSYEINVIDLVAQKPLPNIDTRPLYGPHGLDFAAGKMYFTAQDSKAIGRYDPATARLDWSMGTGQDRTHMIYVTTDGKKVYTTNVSAGTVSILENVFVKPGMMPMGPPPGMKKDTGAHQFQGPKSHWDWTQTIVPVSKGSEGFDVSPEGREIWTVASQDGKISIIDTGLKKVTTTIDAKILGANRLKFTPDGKRVLISSLRIGDLFVYDVATHKEIKRIHIGSGAAGILVDSDGTRAFVACTSDNYVAVINLKTLEVSGQIEVGGNPDGLAWAVLSH